MRIWTQTTSALTLALLCVAAPALAQNEPPSSEAEAARIASDEPTRLTPVRVRGGNHETYGRIVFDWQDDVDYRVGKKGNELHVAFARPASFDTEPTMPVLQDYIGQAAPGPHGYRIVFPLKGTYQIEDWTYGTKVVIDLKKIAEPPAELTQQPPKVRMRVGEHENFGRLVFDWPHQVGYEVQQESSAGQATVQFRRPARLDLSNYAENPPSQVLALSPVVGTRESGIDIQIPKGARVRHFVDGTKVVVDVMAPKRERPQSATTAEADTPAEPEETQAAEALAQNEQPAAPDQAEAESAVPEPVKQAEMSAPESGSDAGQETMSAEPDSGDGPLQLLPPEKPEATPVALKPDAGADPQATPETPNEADASDAVADPILGEPRRFTPEKVAQGIVPKPGQVPPPSEDASVSMPWATRTAATFQHGGDIWFAAEGAAPQSVAAELKDADADIQEITRSNVDGATLLRIDSGAFVRGRSELDDGRWRLALTHAPALPPQPIDLEVDRERTRVRLPVEASGPVMTVEDPASGGRLIVVPVAAPGQGIPLRRRFPEFTLLETHTGIVVLPHADYVTVSREKGAVIVSGKGQRLMLSEGAGRDGEGASFAEPRGRNLLDLERWRRPELGFVEAKQKLQRQLGAASPAERPLARLELARFYFAHGMGVEALGALDLYAKDAPRRAEDPQVLLMRGASQLLAGDWDAAANTLNHPGLEGVAEALPWRAAYSTLTGAHDAAAKGFSKAAPLLEPYPDSVRKQFHLWAAESRLALGDTDGTAAELEKLRKMKPTPAELAQATFLDARRHMMDGEPEKAEAEWREAATSGHGPTRARARFVLAERELAAGERDTKDVIEELERLRFAWRGDEFEAVLLYRLADLYVEEARYIRALKALRQTASHLPDSPLAERATARMRVLFTNLFLDGAADRMPPLKALALYESFRELTPAGPRGDEMISRLADRLVGVDLLTRAAKLLEGQVRHRLDGVQKAETGARLAAIRLLDRAPEKALEALDISQTTELSEDLDGKRRRLRARALAKAGNPKQALALLASDDTEPGLELSADIHSEQGDWAAAAAVLERLLPEPPADGETLSSENSQKVMRAAVAMTLAGHTDALRALSQRYAAAMAESQHAEVFDLLDPSTGGGPVTVAKQLAEVQVAKAFMDSFRDRLESDSQTTTQ